MTNEELLERISNGDESALAKLCLMNTGLVKDRARLIARQYHCLRQTKHGGLSDYAKETLSELESVGKLALVECIRTGSYKTEKGRFTTYVTPFLDGAMRRHLERSMGTLTLDRDSMGLIRKAQRLYYQEEKEPSEICVSLGISFRAVARAITYPTHFFSVYDLQSADDDGDIFERLASDRICRRHGNPHGDYGMSARRVFAALQERAGHPGALFRRIRLSQVRPAGDRRAKPDEGVRRGESQGSGTGTPAGSVPG